MTDDNNTTAGLDQADEDILSYTVSDEALEAAAGTEGGLCAALTFTVRGPLCHTVASASGLLLTLRLRQRATDPSP
jgi:hypothetical protein